MSIIPGVNICQNIIPFKRFLLIHISKKIPVFICLKFGYFLICFHSRTVLAIMLFLDSPFFTFRGVLELTEAIKYKERESEAYISEIEVVYLL